MVVLDFFDTLHISTVISYKADISELGGTEPVAHEHFSLQFVLFVPTDIVKIPSKIHPHPTL